MEAAKVVEGPRQGASEPEAVGNLRGGQADQLKLLSHLQGPVDHGANQAHGESERPAPCGWPPLGAEALLPEKRDQELTEWPRRC